VKGEKREREKKIDVHKEELAIRNRNSPSVEGSEEPVSELRLRRALRRAAHQSASSTAAAASKVAPPAAMPTTRAIGKDIRVRVTSNLQKTKRVSCNATRFWEW
jgi:hypothetical protein